MDLLISILLYLGVYATPADLQNKEFVAKNSEQINKAETLSKDPNFKCDGIVIVGSGNL